jgi:uncharacterized membrane protein
MPHFLAKWLDRIVLLAATFLIVAFWGFPVEPFSIFNQNSNRFVIYAAISGICISIILYGALRSRNSIRRSLAERLTRFTDLHMWWIVTLLMVAYAYVLTSVSIARHLSFNSHAFDLGIFDQAIWTVTQGKALLSSYKENICLLGDHMSPILFLYAPFYLIWNDARTLLVLQSVITASAFIPLTLIAKHHIKKSSWAVFFALLFFLYQPLRHSLRSDFHPEFVANTIIFWAILFLLQNRTKVFLVALGLLLLCKENMYGISFIFGFYLFLQKRYRLGILLMVISVGLLLLVTKFAIPAISGKPYLYAGSYRYLFAGEWGDHPPLLVQPLQLIEYFWKIYLPVGFLSFLHLPTLMLTAPIFLQNILSQNLHMHSIGFQYTTGLTPFVFVSAIFGFATVLSWSQNKKLGFLIRIGLFLCIFVLSLALAGRPEIDRYRKYVNQITPHNQMVRAILDVIPENLSVTTSETLAPHLSHRFQIDQFGDYQRMPAESRTSNAYPIWEDLVILDKALTKGVFAEELMKVKGAGYRMVFDYDGFVILERNDLTPRLNLGTVSTLGLPKESLQK